MTGYVKKRGKNSYSIVVYLGKDPATGKKQYKWYTVEGNKKKAEAELTQKLNELNHGTWIDSTDLSVREFLVDHWLKHAKTQVSGKTYERYESIVKHHLVPELGAAPLVKLHPLAIQAAHTRALEGGRKDGREGALSPQTVLHHHRVLHKALEMAVKWRMIPVNPANAVEAPRPTRDEVRPIDETQSAWLIEAARGTRLYLPILLAVAMGMRRGEILALDWPAVDFSRGFLEVRRSVEETKEGGLKFKAPKSKHGRRQLSIPTLVVEALRAQQIEQNRRKALLGSDYEENGLACCQDDGRIWHPSAFTSAYRDLLRRRSIQPIRFHALRHSHVSQLLRSGVNPKVISERLGHSRVAFTLDVYSHLLPGMQEEAAAKTDAALRAALDKLNVVRA